MKWYQLLSAPVAIVYGAAVLLRNALYRVNVLHSYSVHIPTICVGNLAVGGTGKTPFIEYLIRQLQSEYNIAVLSRGYKRTTRGFLVADEDATAQTIGDEPMQIHTKFPNIPVAVCADRVHGVHKLQERYPNLQVVLLDDAYQHRRLKCGFYILLTAYDNLYIDDHFLPMGSLRDSKHESLRAAAVVVTKCPETMKPINQRIVDTKLHLPTFQQLCFARTVYPELPKQKKILLVTGIAHPEYLLEKLRKDNPKTQLMAFPDHYAFKPNDIEHIAQQAQSVDLVVTTEKDETRLRAMDMPDALKAKLLVVAIQTELTTADNLMRSIHQYINENIHSEK